MSDNDYQRHDAYRHRREGKGQDRYGQLYEAVDQKTQGDGCYYLLRGIGSRSYAHRDGQWVNVKDLKPAET